MPIPGSIREKQFLSEIAEQNVAPPVAAPEFLQEIKEPTHDHELWVEETENCDCENCECDPCECE